MKKIIFFLILLLSFLPAFTECKENKKVLTFEGFDYDGTNYIIIDSAIYNYYGKELYAKSFWSKVYVSVDSGYEFSGFLFFKNKVYNKKYLENGVLKSVKEKIKKGFLYYWIYIGLLFLILFYTFIYDSRKYSDAKANIFTLIFAILNPGIIVILMKFDSTKELVEKIVNYGEFSFTLLGSILFLLFYLVYAALFNSLKYYKPSDYFVTLLYSLLSGLFSGLYFNEITFQDFYLVILVIFLYFILIFVLYYIGGMILDPLKDLLSSFLKYIKKYKNKKTITIKSSEEESKIEENIT